MKDKYLILLCYILIVILFYRQQNISSIEKMTPDSTSSIISQYNSDLASMKIISDITSQINKTGGITVNTNIKINGNLSIGNTNPWVFDGTTNLKISNSSNTFLFNTDGTNNLFKSGLIIAWYSSSFPDGWVECNGENGTPNLVDKFILGINKNMINKNFKNTGGATQSILSNLQIPQHMHSLSYISDGYKYPLAAPNVVVSSVQKVNLVLKGTPYGGDGQNLAAKNTQSYISQYGPKKISDVFISGGLTANKLSNNNISPLNILPPYCILIYIMKI